MSNVITLEGIVVIAAAARASIDGESWSANLGLSPWRADGRVRWKEFRVVLPVRPMEQALEERRKYPHCVVVRAVVASEDLRAEIDAAAHGVELAREDDGALVVSRGEHVLRIERPEIESAVAMEGERVRRSHTGAEVVVLEREPGVVVLYRPVGDVELGLVAASGWSAFPPRLPEQPIFYPVTNLAYAREIAERWNAAEGRGVHGLRFQVREADLARWLPVRCVGARHHTELWVPAAELGAFNAAVVGAIEEVKSSE